MGRQRIVVIVALVLAAGLTQGGESRERFLSYRVERIDPPQAPTIDGKLDEPVWQNKEPFPELRIFNGARRGENAAQKADIVLLTDGKKLYLGARLHEPNMKVIAANPANAPFANDCLEMYMDPRRDGRRNIQLNVDVLGQKYCARQYDDGWGWLPDSAWSVMAQWDTAVQRTPADWTVEIVFDCATFDIKPAPGSVVGLNICWFRQGAGELSAWGYALDYESWCQKSLKDWGHLVFGAPGERAAENPLTAREVRAIVGKLAGRRVEIPAPGGLLILDEAGDRRVSFKEVLQPKLRAIDGQLGRTEALLTGLTAPNPRLPELQKALAAAKQEAAAISAVLGGGALSLATYDRLATRLQQLGSTVLDLYHRAKIVEYVAANEAERKR